MNTSINDFKEALAILTDYNQKEAQDSGLSHAAKMALDISQIFQGVNPSLQNGWETISDFMTKIFNELQGTYGELYEEMNAFADQSYQSELAAKNAVDKANEIISLHSR